MMQAIASGVWTKLDGYDVDVWHNSGCSINVEVVDGGLATGAPAHARVELRPAGGDFRPGWRAPIAGWYRFGSRLRHGFGVTATLTVDQLVIEDAAAFETENGTVVTGPTIAMCSSGILDTEARHTSG